MLESMSRLVARILLSIFVFPLAGIVYIVVAIAIVYNTNGYFSYSDVENVAMLTGGAVAWLFMITYWVMLWQKAVRWSTARVIATLGAGVGAMLVATMVGALIATFEDEVGVFICSITAPIVWVVLTVPIWRETKAERAARVGNAGREAILCPSCGYNLTGLTETRCPECGTQYTIDQLFAEQPGRAAAELEA